MHGQFLKQRWYEDEPWPTCRECLGMPTNLAMWPIRGDLHRWKRWNRYRAPGRTIARYFLWRNPVPKGEALGVQRSSAKAYCRTTWYTWVINQFTSRLCDAQETHCGVELCTIHASLLYLAVVFTVGSESELGGFLD